MFVEDSDCVVSSESVFTVMKTSIATGSCKAAINDSSLI
jgi:hypothetical protein